MMRSQLTLLVASSLVTLISTAEPSQTTETSFDFSVDEPGVRSRHGTFTVGTCVYTPSEIEKPFFDRLSEKAQSTFRSKAKATGKPSSFSLHGHVGQFVSWFGIVREINRQDKQHGGTLLIENKYFDGFTDCHIQTVDFAGTGDFRVELSGVPEAMIPLVLVRVYGVVTREDNKVPVIRAEFVRIWHWFQFNFMDFGDVHGNPKWKRRIHLSKGEKIYHIGTSPKYYDERLGPTGEEWEEIKAFHRGQTEIEFSPESYGDERGTTDYAPIEREQPYLTRVPEKERVTLESDLRETEPLCFQLQGHLHQFVSWFGIIREAKPYFSKPGGTLLIQNTYFKSNVDPKLQTVSLNGAGDFKVELSHFSEDLAPLFLVRIYGNVIEEDGNLPVVEARFVRIWGWDQYNFDDYGIDRTNPRWKENVQFTSSEQAYDSQLSAGYYIRRLGPTNEQAERIKLFYMSDEELQKYYKEREKTESSSK